MKQHRHRIAAQLLTCAHVTCKVQACLQCCFTIASRSLSVCCVVDMQSTGCTDMLGLMGTSDLTYRQNTCDTHTHKATKMEGSPRILKCFAAHVIVPSAGRAGTKAGSTQAKMLCTNVIIYQHTPNAMYSTAIRFQASLSLSLTLYTVQRPPSNPARPSTGAMLCSVNILNAWARSAVYSTSTMLLHTILTVTKTPLQHRLPQEQPPGVNWQPKAIRTGQQASITMVVSYLQHTKLLLPASSKTPVRPSSQCTGKQSCTCKEPAMHCLCVAQQQYIPQRH